MAKKPTSEQIERKKEKDKKEFDKRWKALWFFMNTIEADAREKVPLYLSIDPGAEGAVALLFRNHYHVFDIPTYKEKRGKKKVSVPDYEAIHSLFKVIHDTRFFLPGWGKQPRAMVEQIQPNAFGGSAYTQFRIGCHYAMWPLYLVAMGFNVKEVTPSTWKRKMGLIGDEKDWVRKKAKKLFPEAPLHRKKDHNRAEALLIGEYARGLYRGD